MVKTAKSIKPKIKRVSQKMIEKRWPHYPKPSQSKTFAAQYGTAISVWQHVEEGLYLVYRAITQASRPGAEAAAFYSITSFSAQFGLTNAAFRFAFHDKNELLKEWGILWNAIKTQSKKRNEIVHGMIWTEFSETQKERKIYIGPISTDPNDKIPPKQPNHKPQLLTLKILKEIERDFRTLAASLRQFSQKIPPP